MIVEHPTITPARVGAVVRREWVVDINTADHLVSGSGGWHWVLGDDNGPQWFATVCSVPTGEEHRARTDALEAACRLSQGLPFVVAPVHTRDARIAVDLGPGLLLSVTPYLEGPAFGSGALTGDAERTVVARMAGELHRQPRGRGLPVWRPTLGRTPGVEGPDLDRCLEKDTWAGGPWSGPAGRLVRDAGPVLRQALRRFGLLGAAVSGNVDRWVVTHGEPRARHLVHTLDGPRLVDWSTVALAPRERDLREALGQAEGQEPWYAYLEAGGPPEPLSPDTLELFALQSHLSAVAEHAELLSRPHEDTEDEQRRFGTLEQELGALVARWPGH